MSRANAVRALALAAALAAGSEGRIWGALAAAWSVAFVLAARSVERRAAPTE